MRQVRFGGAASAAILAASAAYADPPAPTYTQAVASGGGQTSFQATHAEAGGSLGDVAIAGQPTVSSSSTGGGYGYGHLIYYVGITPLKTFALQVGQNDFYAKVTMTYHGYTEATIGTNPYQTSSSAMSQISISNGASYVSEVHNCTSSANPNNSCGGYGGALTVNLLALSVFVSADGQGNLHEYHYPQYLKVDMASSALSTGDASASSWTDPIFTLEGDDADNYRLETYDGVGNEPAAVPETASWVLMVIGFGAIGAMSRSRRLAKA